jgi:hypothetical protein
MLRLHDLGLILGLYSAKLSVSFASLLCAPRSGRLSCPKRTIARCFVFLLMPGFSSAIARADFTKTITVQPGVQTDAVTTWYYSNCTTSLGVGSYSINIAPAHGSLAFADVSGPIPGCPSGSPSLPAVAAYYTWTDTTPGATSDYFQLYYELNGQVAEVIDVTVLLAQPPPPLTITTSSLPDATTHIPYTASLEANGGEGAITWSVQSGSTLPAGFMLSPSGVLTSTGTPPAPASLYIFTVVATDSAGASAQQILSLTVLGEGPAVQKKPVTSTSWYVNARRRNEHDPALYAWALRSGFAAAQHDVALGAQNSLVILDFGQPSIVDGGPGVIGFRNPAFRPLTLAVVQQAVQDFALGYYGGTGFDRSVQLRLVVGTNNFGHSVDSAHGLAWMQMIQAIGTWLDSSGVGTQVSVRGGIDIETQYSTPDVGRSWVDGYSSSLVFPYFLYDYGDAGGCPWSSAQATTCGTRGWSQDDVAYVSWEAPLSYPLPEIYVPALPGIPYGKQAQEWQQLSLYSYLNYEEGHMFILGPLSQYQACHPIFRPGCAGADNTPDTAWSLMWGALNSDFRTSQGMIWSTDIKWRY